MKSGNLNFLEPSGPLQTCNGTALPLPLPSIYGGRLLHLHFFSVYLHHMLSPKETWPLQPITQSIKPRVHSKLRREPKREETKRTRGSEVVEKLLPFSKWANSSSCRELVRFTEVCSTVIATYGYLNRCILLVSRFSQRYSRRFRSFWKWRWANG